MKETMFRALACLALLSVITVYIIDSVINGTVLDGSNLKTFSFIGIISIAYTMLFVSTVMCMRDAYREM